MSRHTVKTQAISIYRKLGATSRSETIERMHEPASSTGSTTADGFSQVP